MKLKSKLKSKLKKLLVVLLVFIVVFSIGFSCFAVAPNGYVLMPINVGDTWLEDYGVISPSITNNDSTFTFTIPSGYVTNVQKYFATDFFSRQSAIISNYNDFYIEMTLTNVVHKRVSLKFKNTDIEYDFTYDGNDGTPGSELHFHLELKEFKFPSDSFTILVEFQKGFEGQASLVVDNFYYRNSSTSNIINNQNENADKIIGSLGGNDDYNSPGSGDLGNLEDSESALINGNKAQSDEANNRINDNVLGSIQRLASSFGATAAMFQDMGLKLPDLSVLLYFSLILGIVPIIVGLSINNLRGHDAKVARERRREQYKSKGG